MKTFAEEEILSIKNDLVSSKSAKRRSAAKKIGRYAIVSLTDDLLEAYLKERKDVRTWETQTEMIKAFGKIDCKAAVPYLKEIVDENKDMDTITSFASLSYIRLTRRSANDMSVIMEFLEKGNRSVFSGAIMAMAFDDVLPTEQEMTYVLEILEKRTVYNDPYNYSAQQIISAMHKWQNEMIAPFLQHYSMYPQFEHFIVNTMAGKKSCKE